MRRPFLPFLLVLILLAAGCGDSTGPESFPISGTWRSIGLADVVFGVTIVETARAVEGAGHLISGEQASACRVIGANDGQRASLLFDFDDRDDINFEGEFDREDGETVLIGSLHGGGYSGEQVTFVREDD